MFACVSHEMRTPLNAILNCVNCLDQQITGNTKRLVDIIETSTHFLLSLVNDTLDFTQIKLGKFSLHYSEVNMAKLVNEVAKLISIQISLKNKVKFILEEKEKLPENFRTDEQRLKQILFNILRNSIKFTFQGFIKFTVSHYIEKIRGEMKRAIQFEIYDTGLGIDQQGMSSLFKLFGKMNDAE